MKNKVLVELIVPEIDEIFNVYFPINRRIGNVVELLNKSLNDITGGIYGNEQNFLYSESGEKYNFNSLVRETDIRNGTRVVLF